MNANPHSPGSARRIVHEDMPISASPSGLPIQHLVTEAVGSRHIYVGQQWLDPGKEVFPHIHPVEEALVFLAGTGEAQIGDDTTPIGPGISLYVPPGVVHGFRNTGADVMHLMIVFQGPNFAQTDFCERG